MENRESNVPDEIKEYVAEQPVQEVPEKLAQETTGSNVPEIAPEVPIEKPREPRELRSLKKEEERLGRIPNLEIQMSKTDFEQNLVEVLKNPDIAHQIALSIKPLEDEIAEKKAEILDLASKVQEGFEVGRDVSKDYGPMIVKISLQKDMIWYAEILKNNLVRDFETLRLANLAGGEEWIKAAEKFMESYASSFLDINKIIEQSQQPDRLADYRRTMSQGSLVEKLKAILGGEPFVKTQINLSRREEDMPESELAQMKKTLKEGSEEAQHILESLNFNTPESSAK